MAGRTLTRADILTLLAEHPRRIAELTKGRPVAHLHTAPGPDEWSANDVLAHLRACADVWGGHIGRIVAEDGPTLRGINPRVWMRQTDYPDLAFRASLRAFTAQRDDLLALLEPLPPDAWARTATVRGGGAPQEKNLLFYADKLARHERVHVDQIAAALRAFRSSIPPSRPAGATGRNDA